MHTRGPLSPYQYHGLYQSLQFGYGMVGSRFLVTVIPLEPRWIFKKDAMRKQFNSYIDNIDIGFWRNLCEKRGELRFYDKGKAFITSGTVGRYIGYVKSGALKYVCYSSDGKEHVVGLEFAGHFVCDFPGSLYRQKSRCSIIATVPSEIYCVPASEVAAQMPHDARLREVIAASTREVFATLYDRHVALYAKTPQERYDELISNDPDLFQLFSLKDIASLLNVTPTHLSRLRKKT